MKNLLFKTIFLMAIVSAPVSRAQGQETAMPLNKAPGAPAMSKYNGDRVNLADYFRLKLEVLGLFCFRNDSDFDRTAPEYSYGQQVGTFGTYVRPIFTVRPIDELAFVWDLELGLNVWSRNNPDVGLVHDGANEYLGLGIKQRQVFGEVRTNGFTGRIGYQRIGDVSGLFVNHWIGSVSLEYKFADSARLRGFVGQLPDQTYEGWDFSANNFDNDVFVYGVDSSIRILPFADLVIGAYGMHDGSIIHHDRDLGALALGLRLGEYARDHSLDIAAPGLRLGGQPGWGAKVVAMGQLGQMVGGAADRTDATIRSYGLTAEGGLRIRYVSLHVAGTVMGSDDSHLGNDSMAFSWSGKRPGLSMILSENDVRDLGDNIDERISEFDGKFFSTRAGLGAFDVALNYHPFDSLRIGIVSAGLFALNPDNALGNSFVALEEDAVVEYTPFDDMLSIQVTGGVVIPGKAGAAFMNTMDRTVTQPIGFVQASVAWHL